MKDKAVYLRKIADDLRKIADKKIPKNWQEYDKEVQKLEAEGLNTSDAQGVIDARLMSESYSPVTLKPIKKNGAVKFSQPLLGALENEIKMQAADLEDLSGVEQVVGDGLSGDNRKEWNQLIKDHGFKAVTKAVKKQFDL